MAVAGSAANSAAGDQTVYINSYTSKCFLPNAFRFETATTKGAFAVAEVEITEDMVRAIANKSNIASNFNAGGAGHLQGRRCCDRQKKGQGPDHGRPAPRYNEQAERRRYAAGGLHYHHPGDQAALHRQPVGTLPLRLAVCMGKRY